MIDKNLAEIYRLALTSSFIKMEQVIEWADRKIAQGNEDIIYIDISMSLNLDDLLNTLRSYEGICDQRVVLNNYLSIIYHYLVLHPKEYSSVVKHLYILAQEFCGDLTDIEENNLYSLDDEYYLASKGIHLSIKDVEEHILQFLSQYKKYKLYTIL